MTTTPSGPPEAGPGPEDGTGAGSGAAHPDGARVTRDDTRDIGRLRRTLRQSPESRHIAGVAGGLARHFDIDPVVVRVAMVVLVFFGGSGVILYVAGWLFIPEEGSEESVIRLDQRSRSFVVYLALGVAALALLGDSMGQFEFGWAFFPLVIIALLLLAFRGRSGSGSARGSVEYGEHAGAPGTAPSPEGADGTTGPTDGATGTPPRPVPAARPRDPRRRGPVLFWFTICLIAVALGMLGIIDGATGGIPDSAYPALALGIVGGMLVLGAFWGRAGGLILLGLIGIVGLVGSVAAQEIDGERITVRPQRAELVQPDYDMNTGVLQVDLSDLPDAELDELDGDTLDLSGAVGEIELILPQGLDVEGSGTVSGPGRVLALGEESGGIDSSVEFSNGTGGPLMTVDADLAVGSIEVRYE